MRPLAEQQAEFSAGLLAAVAVLPSGWVGPDGQPDAKRFGVYRNNVASSLIEALREGYPAVHRLVGDEYFSAVARVFIQAYPPESPVMLEYGAAFPPFLQAFEPLASLPYLADVARIERAWHEAYHSPDGAPSSPEVLRGALSRVAADR
ncbi:MAG TPA: DNA-binding domain-containing protein, partial [Steroidobacteraceae bacterium]|nr:DNA-binding domain-containing protein [Steroidobacteraceae bacterium]